MGFPGGSDGKESACNVGDPGLIPELGRSPGKGNGNLPGEEGGLAYAKAGSSLSNPLQYSCLENSTDRGAWWATVHGVTKSQT